MPSACAEDASTLKSKSTGLTFDSETGTPTFLLYRPVKYVTVVIVILKLVLGFLDICRQ